MDMEIREADSSLIRNLFERTTTLGLSSKKAKFLFTKWLRWEKENGDEKSVSYVKTCVERYLAEQNQD